MVGTGVEDGFGEYGRREEKGSGLGADGAHCLYLCLSFCLSLCLSVYLSIYIRLYKYTRKRAWGLGAEGAFCYTINYLFYCYMK